MDMIRHPFRPELTRLGGLALDAVALVIPMLMHTLYETESDVDLRLLARIASYPTLMREPSLRRC